MLRFIIRVLCVPCVRGAYMLYYYVLFAFNMSFTLRRSGLKIHLHSVYSQSVIMTVLHTVNESLFSLRWQYIQWQRTYRLQHILCLRTGTTYDGSIPHISGRVYRIIEERAIIYIAIIKQTTHFSPFLKGEHCIWLWWNSVATDEASFNVASGRWHRDDNATAHGSSKPHVGLSI